ncbi:Fe-S protein assembly co-chaperone HscB [Chitinimonas koreensis]|uniref:Fe-S protein assembly co-chaperone HscB n=1 Tax=Chitinimonas koreensis TaxID=356302 RepID=UPI000403A102|nr:Fe-S protein assembly co-chaperone HscB [Chitinimonas koreensis]QNM98029.1 Fe-S protein assembly co-chaperone HscB [Chitinimonas koreensis]
MDFSLDHFRLFGLPRAFAVDAQALEAAYRALQSQYHPDRAASLGDADKRLALQAATRINEAFQTLKSPLARGRYLLQLAGVDTQEETNTAMPVDFLMAQMEWREAIGEAKQAGDADALDKLAAGLRRERRALEDELGMLLDQRQAHAEAATAVRKLKFMAKLDQEIGDAIDALIE